MRIPHGLRSALASQAAAPTTDEYFSDVSLLLYGDGTNGSTAIVDSSSNNHTVTAYGNAQISTAQSKFGGSSIYLDGYGDYLSLPSSSDWATGTDDFTLECWYYPVSKVQNYPRIFQVGSAIWNTNDNWTLLDRHNTASTKFSWACVAMGGVAMLMSSTTTVTNNTWYHLAVVRDGSTFRLFVNGVQEDTYTNAGAVTVSSATGAWVGSAAGAGDSTGNGYIDDLRFTKGVARYTSNFTPPTASFSTVTLGEKYFYQNSLLLSADGSNGSTAIVDSSANAHTITVNGDAQISTTQSKFGGSSLYFDGSGDYLASPVSDTLSLGTSDFTIECWAWRSANSPANSVLMQMSNSADTYSALFGFAASGNFLVYLSSAGGSWDIASGQVLGSIDNETWVHYALTREGSTFRTFKNGVQQSTWTSSASIYQAGNQVRIGAGQSSASCNYGGYIDDLRITKGVARYTSDFTIPTSEASSSDPYFSSTKLLLNGNGTNGSTAIVDSSSNNHAITVYGDAQISTAQSKFGGSSLYFDGTGDYVTAPSDANFDFGTGDFTIDFWMNPSNAAGTWQAIISRKYNNSGGWRLYKLASSTELRFYYPSTYISTVGAGLTNGTWYHVAVVKNGTTITIYVDGIPRGSGTSTSAMSPTSADVEIGQGVVTSAYPYHGYLDDLRITKGVARYGNFAVPTAGFSESSPILATQALIVAGGGSGNGAGGGAGGLLHYTALNVFKNTTYTITVGAGGDRANNGPLGWGGEHGGDSSIQAGATPITAIGGGGGAAGAYTNGTNADSGYIGGAGGSGGGGGNNAAVTNVVMPGGSGIAGQGNAGGSRTAISGSPAAGGGGHAAAGGQAGGAGTAISIINTTTATSASVGHVSGGLVYFAGGGGAGTYNSGLYGSGGLGGGGVGRRIVDGYDSSQNGLAHTGGGGGGGPASDGGSGVVIFRFPQSSSYQATGTYSAYSESTDTIVIFKGTGTIKWT